MIKMKQKFLSILKYIFLFIFGGFAYILIELLWRGRTHWTMFILGGIAFVSVGLLNNILPWEMNFETQATIGATIITVLEFITGVIVNIIFKMNVWNYSTIPLNFMGQVCLPFSLLWLLLSGIIIIVDDYIRYKFFNEKKPKYKFLFWKNKNRDDKDDKQQNRKSFKRNS